MTSPSEHAAAGRAILESLWATVASSGDPPDPEAPLSRLIDEVLLGTEVGYKKALIIQIAGKAADASLDALSLQRGAGDQGTWDAREFAKRVFVPWNAAIGAPLGQADDPYVSNQFRNPRFDHTIRAQRKNKALFDKTLAVLELANQAASRAEIEKLLSAVLFGVRRLLQGKSFDYPIPQRASLDDTQSCVTGFLAQSSGGARLQAVSHALFLSISDAGFDLADLVSQHVNASDTSTKAPGDVTFTKQGRRCAVEVKDRVLTGPQIEVSVSKARVAEVSELIFIVHDRAIFESDQDEQSAIQIAKKEFSSGLNVYWISFPDLLRALLIVVGEGGRRDFLRFVGTSLEAQNADARHRWAWAQAVSEI